MAYIVTLMGKRRFLAALAFVGLLGLFSTASVAATHLYVTNLNSTTGVVQQYALPISASSTPTLSIPVNNAIGVSVDSSGNMVVVGNDGYLHYYKAPLTAASTPSAVFKNGALTDFDAAFSRSGDFITTTQSTTVYRFAPPFSNSSVPAQSITNSVTGGMGAAFDPAENLYISNFQGNVLVFNPYGGTPVVTPLAAGVNYRKLAVSATEVFVASISPGIGHIDVYTLPLTSASTPAFSITSGVNIPESVAVDPAGNLYVANLGASTVTVYAPPFSASSTPSATLTVPGASILGITIESSTPKGDVNGDGQLTAGDLFYLINYLFANGPPPV
jgi:hypothetical protein